MASEIKPGILCYVLYSDPQYIEENCQKYNGSTIVQIEEYGGEFLCQPLLSPKKFWIVTVSGDPVKYYIWEDLLRPIPPDELHEMVLYTKTKETT